MEITKVMRNSMQIRDITQDKSESIYALHCSPIISVDLVSGILKFLRFNLQYD